MLKRFYDYLDEFTEPHSSQDSGSVDFVRIKVANRLIVTGFFTIGSLIIFNSIMGFYDVVIIDLIIIAILAVSIKLNRIGKDNLGVPLITISLISLTFGAMFFMPHIPNGSLVLVGLVGLPFVMIKKKLRILRYISVCLCIGFYLYAEFFLNRPSSLSSQEEMLAGIFMVLVAFSLMIFQYKYWEATNLKSHEKLLKQQVLLNETNQLSNLGVISAGIAHEINNPLAIIQGNNHLLKRISVKIGDEVLAAKMNEKLIKQSEALERISGIVQGLKTLSRDGRNDDMLCEDVDSIINESLGLCLENAKSKGIRVLYARDIQTYKVECQRIQIGQVLLNLTG